jgi:WxL domain surface cell wall-binding
MLHLTKHFSHLYQGALLLVMIIGGGLLLPGMTTPAFADSPPVNGSVTGGAYSETSAASYSFSGTPGSIATYTMPFTSNDLSGSAEGWHLSITSTQFTSTTTSTPLPLDASDITSTTATCTVATTCSDPTLTNDITTVVPIPAATTAPTAVTFFGAIATTGAGTYTVTPTINVFIPGGTRIGSYTSTTTLAIESGP